MGGSQSPSNRLLPVALDFIGGACASVLVIEKRFRNSSQGNDIRQANGKSGCATS